MRVDKTPYQTTLSFIINAIELDNVDSLPALNAAEKDSAAAQRLLKFAKVLQERISQTDYQSKTQLELDFRRGIIHLTNTRTAVPGQETFHSILEDEFADLYEALNLYTQEDISVFFQYADTKKKNNSSESHLIAYESLKNNPNQSTLRMALEYCGPSDDTLDRNQILIDAITEINTATFTGAAGIEKSANAYFIKTNFLRTVAKGPSQIIEDADFLPSLKMNIDIY